MATVKRIVKGDLVKIISGANKGTTGKVTAVLAKDQSVLIEGVGVKTRTIKPSRQNPRGGKKELHVPTSLHKVALAVDEKANKTSRIGLTKDANGNKVRVARQLNNKEIK